MNEQIDRHFEWIAENPRYGYLIVGGILLLWLIGVICGWKWTYSLSTWGWNWVRETFGEKALRIWQAWRVFILPRYRKRKNGMPYEETGIYRARTKTTFELEVVKHRGVYG